MNNSHLALVLSYRCSNQFCSESHCTIRHPLPVEELAELRSGMLVPHLSSLLQSIQSKELNFCSGTNPERV